MRVLIVEAGKAPRAAEMEDALSALQEVVGGTVQAVYPFEERVALICNDEGKLLGLPLNMDGSEGPRAELCRAFARQLEELSGLPVHLWDERRTTVEAHQILSQQHYHGKKRKNTVDAVAASLILEGYLSFLRR